MSSMLEDRKSGNSKVTNWYRMPKLPEFRGSERSQSKLSLATNIPLLELKAPFSPGLPSSRQKRIFCGGE